VPLTKSAAPYEHWMRREIYEQPDALAATLLHFVHAGDFRPGTCAPILEWLRRIDTRLVIAASGSSRHAGLVAQLLIKDLSGLSVDVEYASEYSYQPEDSLDKAVVMVVSQSGETADTLAALRKANAAGLETVALTNVPQSTMDREALVSFPTAAGPERAIPATKSFTAQLLNLYLLSLMAAQVRNTMDDAERKTRLAEIAALPARIAAQLKPWEDAVKRIVDLNRDAGNFIFLGRGIHYPIALEGALKLKESAYIHAEGYPSGELKHGPNALVADGTPLIMLATVNPADPDSLQRYEKVVQLMRDMRTQGATIIALANTGDATVAALATHVLSIAPDREVLMTISEVIPLQLFSYWVAVDNGVDVDHPRNLTKAVLAE
jgi:glucosamine--fructose-6-phosphate aminotransferase (isomerizing)